MLGIRPTPISVIWLVGKPSQRLQIQAKVVAKCGGQRRLVPADLLLESYPIHYRITLLPSKLGAGGGFEPPTFRL